MEEVPEWQEHEGMHNRHVTTKSTPSREQCVCFGTPGPVVSPSATRGQDTTARYLGEESRFWFCLAQAQWAARRFRCLAPGERASSGVLKAPAHRSARLRCEAVTFVGRDDRRVFFPNWTLTPSLPSGFQEEGPNTQVKRAVVSPESPSLTLSFSQVPQQTDLGGSLIYYSVI